MQREEKGREGVGKSRLGFRVKEEKKRSGSFNGLLMGIQLMK